jgi:uncharacterized membrane protein YphA (DoxX/SURF4 family)
MKTKLPYPQMALSLYIAIIFIQSLFFKFSDAPDTQHIFGTLDSWAGSYGFPGLFNRGGIFSAIVIGSAELVASTLLLLGFIPKLKRLRPIGALMALCIISGAIFFHLFTPLGVQVNNDGGLLFGLACGVWLSALSILVLDRFLLLDLIRR